MQAKSRVSMQLSPFKAGNLLAKARRSGGARELAASVILFAAKQGRVRQNPRLGWREKKSGWRRLPSSWIRARAQKNGDAADSGRAGAGLPGDRRWRNPCGEPGRTADKWRPIPACGRRGE